MQATLLALLGAAAAPGGDAAVAPGAGLAAAQWSSHADAASAGASLAALDTAHAARGALGASSSSQLEWKGLAAQHLLIHPAAQYTPIRHHSIECRMHAFVL
jgi:hypothetical protein